MENKTYQELFNETIKCIRFAVRGAVMDESPLMRTIVSALYNFSDDLIENGIIRDRQQGNEWKKV